MSMLIHAFVHAFIHPLAAMNFLPEDVVRPTSWIKSLCWSYSFKRAQLRAREKVSPMASADRERSSSVLENENIVQLNVGGTVFLTTKDTLLVDTASYFSSLLNGRYRPDVDSFGKPCYFIDRDPTHFRHIL